MFFLAFIILEGNVIRLISISFSMMKPTLIRFSLNDTGRQPVNKSGNFSTSHNQNLLTFFFPNEKVEITPTPLVLLPCKIHPRFYQMFLQALSQS